jgi:hypothetical protein
MGYKLLQFVLFFSFLSYLSRSRRRESRIALQFWPHRNVAAFFRIRIHINFPFMVIVYNEN